MSADHEEHDSQQVESKTARKKEAEALQKLGLRLAELSDDIRAGLALDDKLSHAINEYNRFPSREAKRRQLQFIGKLMRDTDTEAIEAALSDLDGESAQARFTLHQSERWREQLIAEDEALQAFIDAYPQVDRQALRHAIRKVRSAKDEQQTKVSARALFRLIRDTIQANETPPT